MDNNELQHHGILGQKWGVRRYQNDDGTYTRLGKARLRTKENKLVGKERIKQEKYKNKQKLLKAKLEEQSNKKLSKIKDQDEDNSKVNNTKNIESLKQKSYKDMSNEELQAITQRNILEQNYLRSQQQLASLQPKPKESLGKKFVKSLGNDVLAPALKESGRRFLTDFLNKKASEILGVNTKNIGDDLAKEVKNLKLKKEKMVLDDYFAQRKKKEQEKSEKGSNKEQAKESKKEQARQDKESKKEQARQDKEPKVTVEDKKQNEYSSDWKYNHDKKREPIEVEYRDVDNNSSKSSNGSSYVSSVLNSNIYSLPSSGSTYNLGNDIINSYSQLPIVNLLPDRIYR